jgi:hypothetical protein
MKELNTYWTTDKGKKIPYDKLSDEHLKNIFMDGYRNEFIMSEIKRRGFAKDFNIPVPKSDYTKWIKKTKDGLEYIPEGDLFYIFFYKDKQRFLRWMGGQTCCVIDNELCYYPCDVYKFIKSLPCTD